MRQQRPERNFARRVTPLSAQRNRQQAKPCAPQISRLNCDLPKSTDPCEIVICFVFNYKEKVDLIGGLPFFSLTLYMFTKQFPAEVMYNG